MAELSFRMKPEHRQDLEEILWPVFASGEGARQTALNRLVERLEIDPENMGLSGSNSVENNFRGLLTNTNGSPEFLRVISEIIRTKLRVNDNRAIEGIRELLSPYGYGLQTEIHQVIVVPVSQAASLQQRQADQSWIERNVPSQAAQKLSRASEKLGSSDWEGALSESRLALEALTTNSDFGNGLTELIQRRVIEEGTRDRKKEAELLRTVYGFDSTYGSHGGGATEELARFGYFQTEEAVVFLTKRIRGVRRTGTTLNQWR